MSRHLQVVPPDASVVLPTVEAIDALPVEQLAGLVAELAALQARAAMRLRSESASGRDEDQLLTIEQVAERLAVTEDWLRRRPDLPFIVKLSDGTVRYSSRRLATYIARQTGR
jgi:hypothetical protein